MITIIIISILLGFIPALVIYRLWAKFVYNAFTLPVIIDAYLKIVAALANFVIQMKIIGDKWAKDFPSGGIVHNNTDEPEAIIPR